MLRLAALVSLVSLVLVASLAGQKALAEHYYVHPNGSDEDSGTAAAPFQTIQHALSVARPGDVVILAPGIYNQDVVSQRSGTTDTPITIRGPKAAIIKGGGGARVVEINHDNITLEGFTIDGRWGNSANRTGYRNKLLYVQGTARHNGVSGLRVLRMTFVNAGGECIRLRYFAQGNEIAYSTIINCGIYDFRFNEGGKNGEGIYIGTAVSQRDDGRNPTDEPDASHSNWVHHNRIDTQGNECINIKEGAWGNIVEHNICTGQLDPRAAGMNIQGNANIIRYNIIFENRGSGVRLGGATPEDGVDNEVYANVLRDNQAGGINVQALPQDRICENRLSNHLNNEITGLGREQFKPSAPCPRQTTSADHYPRPAQLRQ